mmetsp:Transcript_95661/g.274681  ORF Transcript_95661/g.274681 Transcript_95661/m.274681 type:complete len:399 (-) Transcript_95661:13-1209(-)
MPRKTVMPRLQNWMSMAWSRPAHVMTSVLHTQTLPVIQSQNVPCNRLGSLPSARLVFQFFRSSKSLASPSTMAVRSDGSECPQLSQLFFWYTSLKRWRRQENTKIQTIRTTTFVTKARKKENQSSTWLNFTPISCKAGGMIVAVASKSESASSKEFVLCLPKLPTTSTSPPPRRRAISPKSFSSFPLSLPISCKTALFESTVSFKALTSFSFASRPAWSAGIASNSFSRVSSCFSSASSSDAVSFSALFNFAISVLVRSSIFSKFCNSSTLRLAPGRRKNSCRTLRTAVPLSSSAGSRLRATRSLSHCLFMPALLEARPSSSKTSPFSIFSLPHDDAPIGCCTSWLRSCAPSHGRAMRERRREGQKTANCSFITKVRRDQLHWTIGPSGRIFPWTEMS